MLKVKQIVFIHIPKTAGTSVNHVLKAYEVNKCKRDKRYNYHDPYFLLQNNNPLINEKRDFVFSVVRNPFTRTYSSFNHFNRINELNVSFDIFLDICLSRSHKFPTPDREFWKTPMIFYPQSVFLYKKDGSLKKNNIYKFEDLTLLEKKLGSILKTKMNFPLLNMGDSSNYYESYTPQNIERVLEIYSSDFHNFNYSQKFDV